jgi:hypothetical protein
MRITSFVKRALASCAIAAVACTSLGGMPGAHAASAKATFLDPSRTYTLTYPAGWTRTKQGRFDLYLLSSDKNALIIASSVKTSDPGPEHIKKDLPLLIRTIGKPYRVADYHMYRDHGIPVYTAFSTYQTSNGQLGVVVLEEAYTGGRLYLVAGVVLDATASTAGDDTGQTLSVLTSLNLQPNILDMPSG